MQPTSHRVDERTPLDEMLDVLSHTLRRHVLLDLRADNPRDADEFERRGAGSDEERPEELNAELYHAHLPKLDRAGFIDWNRETGVVVRGPRFAEIAPLLDLMEAHRDELPDGWL